jgi:hypothetical protein
MFQFLSWWRLGLKFFSGWNFRFEDLFYSYLSLFLFVCLSIYHWLFLSVSLLYFLCARFKKIFASRFIFSSFLCFPLSFLFDFYKCNFLKLVHFPYVNLPEGLRSFQAKNLGGQWIGLEVHQRHSIFLNCFCIICIFCTFPYEVPK